MPGGDILTRWNKNSIMETTWKMRITTPHPEVPRNPNPFGGVGLVLCGGYFPVLPRHRAGLLGAIRLRETRSLVVAEMLKEVIPRVDSLWG